MSIEETAGVIEHSITAEIKSLRTVSNGHECRGDIGLLVIWGIGMICLNFHLY